MIDQLDLMGEFVERVAEMRDAQRRFFKAVPYSAERYRALRESQSSEREVDAMLRKLKPNEEPPHQRRLPL